MPSPSRSGTLLILVAATAALLVTLALTFFVRVRSDGEESQILLAETQARVMVASALTYVAETARIGWDDPATPEHEEAFGWVDVRTGRPGPLDMRGNPLYRCTDPNLGTGTDWPAVGTWMICDARLWTRPPIATKAIMAPNPVGTDPSRSWAALVGFPALDPQPASTTYSDFLTGDPRLMPGTDNPCWFRVYRSKPAVFIITCGAGRSGGYRSWSEVQRSGQAARWGSAEMWESQRLSEPMLWYETEWNAAICVTSSDYTYQDGNAAVNAHPIVPRMINQPYRGGQNFPNSRNQMGTFLYLQRLQQEPANW